MKDRSIMIKVFDFGGGVYCNLHNGEYYVYGIYNSRDPRVVPSEAMARSVAAKAKWACIS